VLENPHLLEGIMSALVVRDSTGRTPTEGVRFSVAQLGRLAVVSRQWRGVALGEGLWGPAVRRALPVTKYEEDIDRGSYSMDSCLQAMLRKAGGSSRAFMAMYGRGLLGGRAVRDSWADNLALAVTVTNEVTGHVALLEGDIILDPRAEGGYSLWADAVLPVWINRGGVGPGVWSTEGRLVLRDEVNRVRQSFRRRELQARVSVHSKRTGQMALVWDSWDSHPKEVHGAGGLRCITFGSTRLSSSVQGGATDVVFKLSLTREYGADEILFSGGLEVSAGSTAELGALITSLLE
jgi:hypothetical protein